ncbi:hypothetical protein BGX38DRAFT_572445 [Terfezia claveryi]|nr:hypothetical protein BGX38DRAFT_572445 [Terfezia claveryi]
MVAVSMRYCRLYIAHLRSLTDQIVSVNPIDIMISASTKGRKNEGPLQKRGRKPGPRTYKARQAAEAMGHQIKDHSENFLLVWLLMVGGGFLSVLTKGIMDYTLYDKLEKRINDEPGAPTFLLSIAILFCAWGCFAHSPQNPDVFALLSCWVFLKTNDVFSYGQR